MKSLNYKIVTFFALFILLFAMPISANAQNKSVTIDSASATTSTISVSGSTEALAVMVQVRDSSGNILKMESFGTQNQVFSATIDDLSLTAGSKYTVYVADYEGGSWATNEVSVAASSTGGTDSGNSSDNNSGASDSNSSDNSTSSSDSSSSSNTATATAEAKVEVAKTTEKVGNITTVVPSKDPVTIQGKPNEIEKVQEKESSSDKDGHDEEISAWEKRLNEAQNEGKLLVDFGDIGRATFESEEEYVWNAINEAINSQTPSSSNGKEEKQTVQIEMAGVTEVPASLFETIKGRDVTVELNMCEGISWTINGQDVNNIDFSSINLEVKMDNGDIPDDKTKELAGDKATLNLSLSHDGEFGFNATLTVDVGKENAGQYANLYYFNPVTGEYEYRTSGNIDSNGKTPLGFGHASDYTIVIDTVSHEAANAAAATMAGVAVPGGFDWPLLLIGIGVMVLAIVVIVLLKSKKMSKQ